MGPTGENSNQLSDRWQGGKLNNIKNHPPTPLPYHNVNLARSPGHITRQHYPATLETLHQLF